MQSLGPAPAVHGAAGKLVNNNDFVVAHNIVYVFFKQNQCAQGGVKIVHQIDIAGAVQRIIFVQYAFFNQDLFDFLVTLLGNMHGAIFFIHRVIAFLRFFLGGLTTLFELFHNILETLMQVGAFADGAGNNQWCTGLVDQNRVNLVDNGKELATLDLFLGGKGHIVAQVIKTEFVIGAIGNVGCIGLLLGYRVHTGNTDTGSHAEEVVEFAHPLCITAGQIVIYRNDMHTLAGQRIKIGCQGRNQGLAFTGTHLGNLAAVQHHAADQLYIKVAHTQYATTGLPDHGKGFGEELIKGFAFVQAFTEFYGFCRQLLIAERFNFGFQRIDLRDGFTVFLDNAVIAAAKDLFNGVYNHCLLFNL